MSTLLLTLIVFGVAMAVMAVGYIITGRCLRGSCGGPSVTGSTGEQVCGYCGRKKEDSAEKN